MDDAGELPGYPRVELHAINAQGFATGFVMNAESSVLRGVIYANGRLHDLTSLLDTGAYTITEAGAIADTGEIAVTASNDSGVVAAILRPK